MAHGGTRRSPFPQRSGRAGDRDRRAANSCASARRRRSIIRTSSSTWATTARSSAPIARRFTATIRRSIRMRRGRRNARWRARARLNRSATPAVASCAPRHHRRRRHRRADRGAGAGARRLPRHRAGTGARKLEETGAGIQLSPNATRILIALGLRERLAPHVVAPDAVARDGRRLRPRDRAHPARRRSRAPLRRALLGRSIAAICRRRWPTRRRRRSRHHAQARHPRRGFRRARQGRQRARPARPAAADERGIALIGADGLWSSVARRAAPAAAAALSPSHRLARAGAGRAASPAEFRAAARASLARRATRIWCTTRCKGGSAHQHRRHRARRMARAPAGRRPATRAEMLRAFRALVLGEPRARPDRHARALAEMGAVRPRAAVPRRQRPGDAARGRRPPDAAVSGARRRRWRSRTPPCSPTCWRATRDDPADALRAYEARAPPAHRAGATRRAPARPASMG